MTMHINSTYSTKHQTRSTYSTYYVSTEINHPFTVNKVGLVSVTSSP